MSRSPASRAALLLTAASAGLAAVPAHASCHPDFGEQLEKWVEEDVASQSRRLAEGDYQARVFNYYMLAGDDLNARLDESKKRLDRVLEKIKAEEAAAGRGEIRDAMVRDRSGTRLLNELYAVRTEIDEIISRGAQLAEPPTREAFLAKGLQNVGRATLLASLQELGDARQQSLNGRYSVYVQMTVNDSGEIQDAEVQYTETDMVDSVVYAGALQFGGPYAPVIIVMFKFSRLLIEDEICRRRIKEQQELWNKAVERLPSELLSQDRQFEIYEEVWRRTSADFAPLAAELDKAASALDANWREVFAYNAARQKLAAAVLTTANVDALRREYETGGPMGSVFNNMALTTLAGDMGRVNDYFARGQADVLRSCGNLDGFLAAENQRDALAYGEAALTVFGERPEFAPLHSLVRRSLANVKAADAEVRRIESSLGQRPCGATPSETVASFDRLSGDAKAQASAFLATDATVEPKLLASAPEGEALTKSGSALMESLAEQAIGHCILYRRGGVYDCDAPGSGGSRYQDQFGQGNPRDDVLGGASDGGYANDGRSIAREVRRVSDNLEQRIAEVGARSAAARAALPDWIDTNRAFLLDRQAASTQAATQTAAARSDFIDANAGQLASSRQRLTEFAALPTQQARTDGLVREVGASVLQLPGLRADAVVPGLPSLPGITASTRVYGTDQNPATMAVTRERAKVEGLPAGSLARTTAVEALDAAASFGAGDARLAGELVKDSAAIRFATIGVRDTIDLAILHPDGRITREPVESLEMLPPEALIARLRDMSAREAAFETRAGALQDVLSGGDGTPEQVRALAIAEDVHEQATALFSLGELLDSDRIMQYATAMLDVAVSLTPGISWGRDIYETVTGRDLFSDEELDGLGYSAAVIGAISFGVGDDALDWYRAVKRVAAAGREVETAEKIVKGARRINLFTVNDEGIHIVERAGLRSVTNDEWNGLLETGARYFDIKQGNVAVAMPSRYVGLDENGIERTYQTVVGIIDPLNERNGMMKAVTVIREETDDLTRILTGDGLNRRQRYIPLGPAPD